MATYKHGITISELATALQPMITVEAPTVAVGTAVKGPINEPTLIHSMSEFQKTFGWSTNHYDYSLCEVADVFFNLYNVAPVIFINCLDPSKRYKACEMNFEGVTTAGTVLTLKGNIPAKILVDGVLTNNTVVVTSDTTVDGAPSVDTLLEYDPKSGHGSYVLSGNTLTIKKLTKVHDGKLKVAYKISAPGKVTEADVRTGIEQIERVFPKLGLVPGTLIAPRWSFKSSIAKKMISKAKSINGGIFKTFAVCDISAASTTAYSKINTGKTAINLVSEFAVACWPQVMVGKTLYYLSTHVAALMNQVDDKHDGIPYESPSNKILQIDGAFLHDKTPVYLSLTEANYLNGRGVATALNFSGQRLWGNRTSIYPSSSDPKDSWIPVRRMFNYVGNTLVLSFFSQIDDPVNQRLIDSVLDRANDYLNGLAARGAIMPGSRVYFLEAENPLTDLADGKMKFHLYLTPPPPAESITFVLEYDVKLLSSLFD